ncbi:hypothetical protein T09_10070, partial [Trichinella sp. T9]
LVQWRISNVSKGTVAAQRAHSFHILNIPHENAVIPTSSDHFDWRFPANSNYLIPMARQRDHRCLKFILVQNLQTLNNNLRQKKYHFIARMSSRCNVSSVGIVFKIQRYI